MSGLYFSRALLRRDAAVATLAPLLLPSDPAARNGAAHRLVWSLFAGQADQIRDFLYRELPQASAGQSRQGFLILSRRPPDAGAGIFEIETKPFAPALKAGDRLGFSLRASPAVNRRDAGGGNRRHDVVMDALKATPSGPDRAAARARLVETAGRAWLVEKGVRSGFALPETSIETVPEKTLRIDGYDQIRLPREGKPPIRISVLEFEGVLTVTEPENFLTALAGGFGRAKAFGCGLMLIRRA